MSGGLAHLGHLKRLLARRSVLVSVAELGVGPRSRYSTTLAHTVLLSND